MIMIEKRDHGTKGKKYSVHARQHHIVTQSTVSSKKTLRKTGISLINEAPWGTHFCQFYKNKQDLIDILVPYFTAGLENNEFCMWITSEPLHVEDAFHALKKKISNLSNYVHNGQIEILDSSQWYTKDGKFDSKVVLNGWISKERQALKRGFDGLRLSGNTFWLEKKDWKSFTEYEATVNRIIGNYRMIALCSYSLKKCTSIEVIDVVSNHQFALIKDKGSWKRIESCEQKETIEEFQKSQERYQNLFETMTQGVVYQDAEGKIILANPAAEKILGLTHNQIMGRTSIDRRWKSTHEDGSEFLGCNHPSMLALRTGKIIKNSIMRIYNPKTEKFHWININAVPQYKKGEKKPYQVYTTFEDITERILIQKAFKQAEIKYRTVADNTYDFEFWLDPKGNYLYVSPSCKRITGYSQKEFVSKPRQRQNIVYPKDKKAYHNHLIKEFKDLKPGELEFRIVHKDGSIRWIHHLCRPIYDTNGTYLGIRGSNREITDRKQIEEEMQAHRELLDTVVNYMPVSVNLIRGSDLKIQFVNNAYQRIAPGKKMVDKTLNELWPETGKNFEKICRSVLTTGKSFHVKDEMNMIKRKPNGPLEQAFFSWSLYRVHLPGNEGWGLLNVAWETTENKKSEDKLRESEEKYRTIVENTSSLIMVTQPNGIISYLSPSCSAVLGYPPNDLIGTSPNIFYPEDKKKVHDALSHALKGEKGSNFEYRIITKNGETKWLAHSWSPIFFNGTLQMIVSIIDDITLRKEVEIKFQKLNEALLRHSIDLVTVNRELEAFSYSVSHDLRAPLRSIDGFSQALLEDYSDKLDDQGKDYIQRVRKATQRMGQLIDDILRLSRLSRTTLSIETFNFSNLAQGIIDKFHAMNPSRIVTTIIQPKIKVNGDKKLLEILLDNLIGNAWKFTTNTKQPEIAIGQMTQGNETVYFVRDNGAGFNMAYADKLFIPFQRLHAVDEYPGTGIGLALVSRIVHRHGGRIWAEAEVNKGATFYFTLQKGGE
jgi:PAS domain S-box-containing protein